MVLKLGHFKIKDEKYLESFECGAEEGWRSSAGLTCRKWRNITQSQK